MFQKSLQLSFNDLRKMENVSSASSEAERSPMLDNNITLFLSNGYRVVSDRSILGQSISLEHLRDLQKPSYCWMFIRNLIDSKDSFDDICTKTIRHSDEEQSIDSKSFFEVLHQICGPEVFEFLMMRHRLPQYIITTAAKPNTPSNTL